MERESDKERAGKGGADGVVACRTKRASECMWPKIPEEGHLSSECIIKNVSH